MCAQVMRCPIFTLASYFFLPDNIAYRLLNSFAKVPLGLKRKFTPRMPVSIDEILPKLWESYDSFIKKAKYRDFFWYCSGGFRFFGKGRVVN